MPVLDGMGVLEQLRAGSFARVPRVIVLTAYGSIAAAVQATRLGALDFLEKPVTPQDLRETVEAVLHEPQAAETAQRDNDASSYADVLSRVRVALRASDVASAESLLMKAADLGEHDAAYFNLLGVIYELRRQWRLAQKMYGKSSRADKHYEPAQQNLRRVYELNTFGRTSEPAAIGDGHDALAALRAGRKT
jgi:response regulator RpfG family c-di-GMP phosphodiesterase